MKNIVALALTTVFALGLYACGNANEDRCQRYVDWYDTCTADVKAMMPGVTLAECTADLDATACNNDDDLASFDTMMDCFEAKTCDMANIMAVAGCASNATTSEACMDSMTD